MKMDTAKLVVFGHFISVLIFSFGLELVVSSRDVALHKDATQSSTLSSYFAGRAVDGIPGRDGGGGHCSHTRTGHNQAWWKVDLGDVYRIQTINITYRRDCCSHTNFGPNCSNTCHCMSGGCDPDTGVCHIPGCQHGWTGDSCSTHECPSGYFGPDCSTECHCKTGGCYIVNGSCNTRGCQDGWRGNTCNQECVNSTFGQDCNQTCHCANSGCDRISGTCTIPGCTEGWTGGTCSQECLACRFGKDCLHECHCKLEGCDKVDGTCNVTGCVDGWRGKSCDHTCDFTHYGPNCLHECHCNISGCSNTDGICQTPGCEDGWTGPSCSAAQEQISSKSECPHIAEVSTSVEATCTTCYALFGTLFAISIICNIGLIIHCVRMRFQNSRTQTPPKELQTYRNHEEDYDGIDSSTIDKTRNIYDTIVQ
ncbi:multiple epidermal growth factor-like domains protein 10 [Mizuhopecten yessoensis]|uniref:multiple epidermal growth factor-like domains protein 10 n=1 Tax=Mizuhopecten yessoensis TaxID=6573 RepID=UPI000B4592BD|nr:multiple epidermal growth factor-like domains protein 10 [Mizuhopecten yessoensis]